MVKEHIEKISGRKADSHKGDFGKVFVIAGSVGFTGAAFLSAQGALRAGSGLVTCGIPESLNDILEVKLTEAMTLPLNETKSRALSLKAKTQILDFSKKCDVVAIGPGLGTAKETFSLVKKLAASIEKPIVLDADGINAFAGEAALLKKRKGATVLTPHPGEMARLTGKGVALVQANREAVAKKLSKETGAVVCLKGHKTVVANPAGNVYINDTGNSGMATGGTGDVLTGMIASFIAQGIEPYSAAISAVYLHGLAGDIAAAKIGQFSMIATDVIDSIYEAFAKAGI